MDVRDESLPQAAPGEAGEPAGPGGAAGPGNGAAQQPLPDLLGLGLAELRELRHPVLDEVLADLRERAARPSEMLWGFNNAM